MACNQRVDLDGARAWSFIPTGHDSRGVLQGLVLCAAAQHMVNMSSVAMSPLILRCDETSSCGWPRLGAIGYLVGRLRHLRGFCRWRLCSSPVARGRATNRV